jgi:fatty acid desaturase
MMTQLGELSALPAVAPTMVRERPRASTRRDDYAELSHLVRAAGLLEPKFSGYAWRMATTLVLLLGVAVAALFLGHSWWVLALTPALGFALTQLGFIGHDAGHRQVSAKRWINSTIGLVHANLLTGFSYGWWVNKHNRHHAHTNRPGRDPDVGDGALTFTPEQTLRRGRTGQRLARAQAYLLVPLLTLEALNLHVSSIIALLRRRDRGALAETALLAAHVAIFFVAPFAIMSPLRALAFIVVGQAAFGVYLGAAFVTNHIGMPMVAEVEDLGFLRRQVLTSRNVSGGALTSLIFGGLNLQIEHHLFPAMPRGNLYRARAIVRPFCAARGICYQEAGPVTAYREVFRHLAVAGAALPIPVVH